MDSCIVDGALGYMASVTTTIILFPYRDYVKAFDARAVRRVDPVSFCAARYRGMLFQPSQPLLIALPSGLLYTGFLLGNGSVSGAFCGGALHGLGKVGVRTLAYRWNLSHRPKEVSYKSVLKCLQQSVKHYGALSFFSGASATIVISTAWHGTTLVALQRCGERGFFESWWDAFRTHSFLTFVTSPLRNTFRSALFSRERSSGIHNASTFLAGEAAILKEAKGVFSNMLRTEGVRFFVGGVLRSTFKTSLPFGLTFATFSLIGGSLPRGGEGRGNDHRRHHVPHRRFI